MLCQGCDYAYIQKTNAELYCMVMQYLCYDICTSQVNQFSMRTWAAVDVARFMLEVIPSARFTSILRSWVVTPSFKPPHTSHSTRHGALSRGKPISPSTMNDNSCNKRVSAYLVLPVKGATRPSLSVIKVRWCITTT